MRNFGNKYGIIFAGLVLTMVGACSLVVPGCGIFDPIPAKSAGSVTSVPTPPPDTIVSPITPVPDGPVATKPAPPPIPSPESAPVRPSAAVIASSPVPASTVPSVSPPAPAPVPNPIPVSVPIAPPSTPVESQATRAIEQARAIVIQAAPVASAADPFAGGFPSIIIAGILGILSVAGNVAQALTLRRRDSMLQAIHAATPNGAPALVATADPHLAGQIAQITGS